MYEPGMFWALLGMTWVFACAVVLIIIWHLRSKRRLEKMTLVHQERMKAIAINQTYIANYMPESEKQLKQLFCRRFITILY